MTKSIDYYLTLVSPWAFLGHDRFVKIAEESGAKINVIPVNYGKIFSATGGLPLGKRSEQRRSYRLMELARWREELNVPINIHPKFFPASDLIAALMVTVVAQRGGDAIGLTGMFQRLVWIEDGNIADEATAIEVANKAGLNGKELLTESQAPEIKALYEKNTDDAIARGVFGAPTYIIGDELFWGQDRLQFVEKALKK
ncbi:2-hydroxychromene-2-carboxylate isomerase [Sneathiella sp. CAU 1612]|uniref:2-hydroxychromene-2-carboxylate isomerase n=1 Tax=Sneathiella sedimenti TaxID=2816034 RepID=A0ABS3F0K8_9PROT|nr:2-hydroxychromene-2-carboxylate isomerase [uncultured Sneathiella sp.]MBO0332043.1 2-hydroxychromene-2-carboxylate isomerase [Sneathiella sedimenti]